MPKPSLRDRLESLLRSRDYRPMNKSELSRALELSSDDRSALRGELRALEQQGTIVYGKKGRYELRAAAASNGATPQLRGGIKFTPKGHAWFFPDVHDPENQATGFDFATYSRLHVARRATGGALDGDQVLVSIQLPNPKPKLYRRARELGAPPEELGPRAKVERVLDRRSGRIVGLYRSKGGFSYVEPDDFAVSDRIEISGDTTARPGQLVVVQMENLGNGAPRGRIIEVLGWPGDAGVDLLSIIHRNGIRTSFPEDVLAAARAIPDEVDPAEAKLREDWRDRLVITIDPADAKDHDDAIWVGKTPKGWQLAVHIADVSHYVKPGGPLDVEAIERGNSTYLVDRVIPMLPVELSNGLCSLKPDVDRLTKCAVLDVSAEGKVVKARFCNALIHSQAKLSYEQAQDILDGKPAPKGLPKNLAPMVREAWAMASTLRKKRFADGALDLEMPEVRVRLDDKGHPVSLDAVHHTESHQLIEECMLAANEAVARILKNRSKPAIYRVHEDPDHAKLQEFAETARAYGYRAGDLSNKRHVQQLLDAARGRPDEHAIKIGLLKSLKRAVYAAEPLGHYGLSKGDYCHFTSPIRRYADVVVHRALQPFLDNPPKQPDKNPPQAKLAEIARHISTTERASADAEGESRLIKLLQYLDDCSKADPPVIFEGLITEVRSAGLLVEATDISTRGMVRRGDLPGGPWRIERNQARLVGPGGVSYQMGQRVKMVVANIDHDRRFVDFRIFDPADNGGPPKKRSRYEQSDTPQGTGRYGRHLESQDPKPSKDRGRRHRKSAAPKNSAKTKTTSSRRSKKSPRR